MGLKRTSRKRGSRTPRRNAGEQRFWILVDGKPYVSEEDGNPGTIFDYMKDHHGGKAARYMDPGESTVDPVSGAVITRVGGDAARLVNVTFEIVTPESAEEGDVAERGWEEPIVILPEDIDHDEEENWVDATKRALKQHGYSYLEADTSHGVPRWFTETESDQDRSYFERGEERRESFHPEGFTDHELVELAQKLGVYGSFRANTRKRASRRAR